MAKPEIAQDITRLLARMQAPAAMAGLYKWSTSNAYQAHVIVTCRNYLTTASTFKANPSFHVLRDRLSVWQL